MSETCSVYSENKKSPSDEIARLKPQAFDYASEIRIAHLLMDAKIISPDQLEAGLSLALQFNQPLTKTLAIKYNLPAETISGARHGQKLVDDLRLDRFAAADALAKAHSAGLPYVYVIDRTDKQTITCDETFSELESILIESGITTPTVIKEARSISIEQDMSLGASLLSMKTIPFAHINYTLECVNLLNRGLLTKAAAVRAMSLIANKNVDLRYALEQQGFQASNTLSRIKVGDLLLQVKVITEEDLLAKIEEALATRRLIGSLLVESGLIDQEFLIDVLIVQTFCMKDLIDKQTAVKLLRKTLESDRDLAGLAKDYNIFRDNLETAGGAIELLIKAGLTDSEQIDQAEARYFNYGMDRLNALVAAGSISPAARKTASECAYLYMRKFLSEEEAIYVLKKCDGPDNDLLEEIEKMPMARLNETVRGLDQKITSIYKTDTHLKPKLYKSGECVWVLTIFLLALVGCFAATSVKSFNMGGYGLILVTFFAGVALIPIGIRWDQTVCRKLAELEAQEESAKGTVKRLSHSRSKFA